MSRRYRVISADGHVETPPDFWLPYVPESYRDRAPRLVKTRDGGDGWLVEGQPLLSNGANITGRGPVRLAGASFSNADGRPAEGTGSAAQRLREQDEDGIDAEVLFPPVYVSRFIEAIRDKDIYRSIVRAYNTFLALDYCAIAPDRLIGNATLPVSGVDDAIDELEFAAQRGLPAVCLHQFPNGSGFSEAQDDDFWSRSLELGMKLCPHFGFGERHAQLKGLSSGDSLGLEFASVLSLRAESLSPVFCIAQLIASGVFDRFPDIRFYFAETNASWLPFALFVLDDNYEIYRECFGVSLPRRPSEYVREHCHFGIVRDPVAIDLREKLPIDNIMFGTDFPHSVGTFPQTWEFLEDAFSSAEPEIRQKLTLTNAADFFGLDLEASITETPAG